MVSKLKLVLIPVLIFLFTLHFGETRKLLTQEVEILTDDEDADDQNGRVSLGDFTSYAHRLGGEVTLIDDKTAQISGLNYDGTGPAAWFMVGKTERSSLPEFIDLDGTVIPDESESCDTLKAYNGDDVTLKLPGEMKFSDYDYIAMYCLRFNHNFGYVTIPDDVKLKNGTSTLKGCDPEEIEEAEVDSRPASGPRPAPPPPRGPPPPSGSSGSGGLLGGLIDTVSGLLG